MTIPGVLAGASVGNRWCRTRKSCRSVRSAADARRCRESSGVRQATRERGDQAALDIHPMIPLGQFRDTFIIAVDDEGVAIMDQHVAHERVLFEQVMERLTTGRLESQRLLTPIVLELSPPQRQALLQHSCGAGTIRARPRRLRWRQRPAVRGAGASRCRGERGRRARSGRGSRGTRPRVACRRCPSPYRRHDGVPRGGQSQLPAHARKRCAISSRNCAGRPIRACAPTAGRSCCGCPGARSRRIFRESDPNRAYFLDLTDTPGLLFLYPSKSRLFQAIKAFRMFPEQQSCGFVRSADTKCTAAELGEIMSVRGFVPTLVIALSAVFFFGLGSFLAARQAAETRERTDRCASC